MSERDGWNHLYLIDGATGRVMNQITKGEWPVRGVQKVDEEKRQIWFSAGGMHGDQDPYFLTTTESTSTARADAADDGRRRSSGVVLDRHAVLRRHATPASISRRCRSCDAPAMGRS